MSVSQASMDETQEIAEKYDLERLAKWQQKFWRNISQDALKRGCFPSADYEQDCLKPWIKPYRGVFNWLHACSDPFRFETLMPHWEYAGNSEWRLFLIVREDWVAVVAKDSDEATCRKEARILRPGKCGGLCIAGLKPVNNVGDDWEVIEESASTGAILPEVDNSEKKKRWWRLW
ncbi:hypothetical protein BAUCODRAFT_144242 [Baudoinia panamericana UAMH 10762]|uniref:Uncharacterized protein n=1 Tax=Baudoinia panamericana (strain UAMH 10762) TaxID=717646 RepID=M2NN04_BAUPA|nr:uncharacterized protein BAUCODRAFT_144242 [Baudoinia panamericana UAMH 10762]EMD00591.1 hypothetical protein BAUCODRAFT_144242 [Baudoinia panamericana UAMH 10762]